MPKTQMPLKITILNFLVCLFAIVWTWGNLQSVQEGWTWVKRGYEKRSHGYVYCSTRYEKRGGTKTHVAFLPDQT
jgi:hypothetical protein